MSGSDKNLPDPLLRKVKNFADFGERMVLFVEINYLADLFGSSQAHK